MGDGQVGGRTKERWQVVSEKERKDGRIGEVRHGHQGIEIGRQGEKKTKKFG